MNWPAKRASRAFLLVGILLGEWLLSRPFRTDPRGEVSSLGICISFLIRVRRTRKRLRLKVHVVSGDAQCLFRKSSGFSVLFFHVSFSEPQTHVQWAPRQVRLKPDPELLGASEAGAEARGWQACFVTARWQAGKGGFSGASVLTMAGGGRRESGGKMMPLAVRQVEMHRCDKTGQLAREQGVCELCCFPSVLVTCHLLCWLAVTCAG